MARLIPKNKMSKKARKALNDMKRVTWGFAPVTRKLDSKKRYRRADPAQKKQWEKLSQEEA